MVNMVVSSLLMFFFSGYRGIYSFLSVIWFIRLFSMSTSCFLDLTSNPRVFSISAGYVLIMCWVIFFFFLSSSIALSVVTSIGCGNCFFSSFVSVFVLVWFFTSSICSLCMQRRYFVFIFKYLVFVCLFRKLNSRYNDFYNIPLGHMLTDVFHTYC